MVVRDIIADLETIALKQKPLTCSARCQVRGGPTRRKVTRRDFPSKILFPLTDEAFSPSSGNDIPHFLAYVDSGA